MDKPLNIVQVNHMFLDGGGREEHIFHISKQLIELGHNVTVVTSDYTASGVPSIGKRAKKIKGLKIVTLKGYLTNVPPGRVSIPDLLDYLIEMKNVDIIHAHGMGEEVSEDALYAAKIQDIPFVFTPHFQPWWAYEKLGAKKIWQVFQSIRMPMVLKNANAVIAVSPQEKNDFIKLCKKENYKNIFQIPNGLAPNLTIPSKEEIKSVFHKYKIPEVDKYLIYLGSVTNPRKGAFEAVQAFRQIREKYPSSHLLVVGPWGSRYINTQPVVEIMQKLAKAKHVTVTGYVPECDKFALLAGSDVMINPTIYEAFGIVIAEALFCKIPVVATNIGGVPYVVRDNQDGILIKNQTDIPAFAKACLKLLNNPQLAKKMGKSGHERVKKIFDWGITAQKIVKIYNKLKK